MTTLNLRTPVAPNTHQQTFIPAPAIQGRITCRVCGLGATVPLDHPALLCVPCLSDLDATRDRVQAWLSAALSALSANQAQWDTTKVQSEALGRWWKVQDALIGVAERRITKATLAATWAKRKAEGGPLAELLVAHERYALECDRLSTELARLHTAQVEINAAWLATNDV